MSKLKNQFSEFYVDKLNEADLEDNLIVFDTNYLLDILKLPVGEARKYLDALEMVKDNIYIPYFVALEFNFNKIGVKTDTKIILENYKNNLTSKLDNFGEEITELKILKTDEFTAPLISLKEEFKKDFSALLEETINNFFSYNTIYADLIKLIENCIGDKKEQDWIDKVQKEGISRYEKEIPPGFNDKTKTDCTQYDDLEFEKKYGDLLIWKEIIEKAKETDKSKVIFVTNDGTSKKKNDILYSTHGRTIGPHIYLMNEMKRESKKELHIINNIRFVELTTGLSTEDLSKLQIAEEFFNRNEEHIEELNLLTHSPYKKSKDERQYINDKDRHYLSIRELEKQREYMDSLTLIEYKLKEINEEKEYLNIRIIDLEKRIEATSDIFEHNFLNQEMKSIVDRLEALEENENELRIELRKFGSYKIHIDKYN